MGLLARLRGRAQSVRLIGRIVDEPQIITQDGVQYMIFRLDTASEIAFHLKLLATTLKRHRGDHVEIVYTPRASGVVVVEALYAAPDAADIRRRNQQYLTDIEHQEEGRDPSGTH